MFVPIRTGCRSLGLVQMTDDTFEIVGSSFRVGDRLFPAADVVVEDHDFPGVGGSFRERRVLLVCESNLSLSILFGEGTYSSNHDALFAAIEGQVFEFTEQPTLVEVGVMHGRGESLVRDSDGAQALYGYCTVADVLDILDHVNRGVVPPPRDPLADLIDMFGSSERPPLFNQDLIHTDQPPRGEGQSPLPPSP